MTGAPAQTSVLQPKIRRLARFSLTVSDAQALAAFYEDALGFRRVGDARRTGADFESAMGAPGGARQVTLRLGAQRVELVQFDRPGRPYPQDSLSSDLVFQHFAIVVADIDRAYRQLSAARGWRAISRDGPQRLPESSGGVSAFKFRDPDGHPLELLAFPEGRAPAHWRDQPGGTLHLGIDHSAISVSDWRASVAYYENLGLAVSARSLNAGPQQARLDGLSAPRLDVVALSPPLADPHLELLCYDAPGRGPRAASANNDIAATRLVFEGDGTRGDAPLSLNDPDGHRLIVARARRRRGGGGLTMNWRRIS